MPRPKPQRSATQPTTPPMIGPKLLAMPPLLDCVLESAAGPDVELLEEGPSPPRALDEPGVGVLAGSELVEVGELMELVDPAEVDVVVNVDLGRVVRAVVGAAACSENTVVKPM